MIKGGYYLKARKIQESAISLAPPHVREIWDWLLKECNHSPRQSSGRLIERGQCVRSYRDILDGLKWKVGYRVCRYSKWDCERAMKWLTKHTMVTTTKTTRGLVITILKYDYYQNPKNYESHSKATTKATREPQGCDTINKNDNALNELKELKTPLREMVGVFCSLFKKYRKGTYKLTIGKDHAILKRIYKLCALDKPDDPLGYFEKRVDKMFEEYDLFSIGGVEAFWNKSTPKKGTVSTKQKEGFIKYE